jgi:diaminopimelate decarboxylase
MVTFDNFVEVQKCAAVSKKIELILRIITDDRGSQCRFSSKFGAPPKNWRPLLAAAKRHGLQVVGVSFHVGSGCRDASKYELALRDAKTIFDMAEKEFGMKMRILDIGGGFPGETHSIWNPAVEIDEQDADKVEGKVVDSDEEDTEEDRFMCFKEIAKKVAPIIDDLFPIDSGVRVIAEPGRYFVAAAATLCCSVVAARTNEMDASFEPNAIDDKQAAKALDGLTREDEKDLVRIRGNSVDDTNSGIMSAIQEELSDYSKLFANQQLTQQEFDVYNDQLDLYEEGFKTAIDLLGPPEPEQLGTQHHTAEGMPMQMVAASTDRDGVHQEGSALFTLAAAGEAAVNGMVLQAVADYSSPLQDDYAYYINDGVYGAFNNLMFDHAHVRPRVLQKKTDLEQKPVQATIEDGFCKLESSHDTSEEKQQELAALFASTVFGPTCDSIDVISHSVLLPKLSLGDWMYFQNMGAYTMAAASSFNGFHPSEKFYVCSVQPEYFEEIIKGPEGTRSEEEKGNGDMGLSDESSSKGEEKKSEL